MLQYLLLTTEHMSDFIMAVYQSVPTLSSLNSSYIWFMLDVETYRFRLSIPPHAIFM